MQHSFAPSILRAYDVRGVWQENLREQDAWALGLALSNSLGREAATAEALVARDGRSSSPRLNSALLQGLSEGGVKALDLGCLPTPALYFAEAQARAQGQPARLAVMVTGSHNPPQHNGFKILRDGLPLHQQALQNLGERARSLKRADKQGAIESREGALTDYTNRLCQEVSAMQKISAMQEISAIEDKPLKIVWDSGGGVSALALPPLLAQMAGEHSTLFEKLDSQFSARSPDPGKSGALNPLVREVARRDAQLGFAFDGDGDRLVVVLPEGRILSGDQLLLLFAHDLMQTRHSEPPLVLADVKTRPAVMRAIAALGARPQLVATGHANVKHAIAEHQASLAGEVSGHFFFPQHYYGFDDALYAAVRLCLWLSRGGSVRRVLSQLPASVSSGEIRLPFFDHDKFAFVEKACRALKARGEPVDTLDGARIVRKDSWWLLRASNTEETLVVCVEASDSRQYRQLLAEIRQFLESQNLSKESLLPLPLC